MTTAEKLATLRAECDRLKAEHKRLADIADAANEAEHAAYMAWSRSAAKLADACDTAFRRAEVA